VKSTADFIVDPDKGSGKVLLHLEAVTAALPQIEDATAVTLMDKTLTRAFDAARAQARLLDRYDEVEPDTLLTGFRVTLPPQSCLGKQRDRFEDVVAALVASGWLVPHNWYKGKVLVTLYALAIGEPF
jgi:hypothetical protein